MNTKYKVFHKGDSQYIERLIYPKFIAVVSCDTHWVFDDITIDEDIMDAKDITNALEEAEQFLNLPDTL